MTLKEIFSGYLGFDEEQVELIWNEALVFVDTNSLLNLYEYSQKTFEEFKEIFENTFFRDRVYITYQVGLEFSRNKSSRIVRQIDAKREIDSKTEKSIKEVIEFIRRDHRNHSVINTEKIIKILSQAISDTQEATSAFELEKMKTHHKSVDEFIYKIISSRITDKPSSERISEIIDLGRKRYEKLIPPGYLDRDKSEDTKKFGDLIIWLEIIRYALNENISSIIFITDDAKEDWWERVSGRTLGANPLLVQEMYENGIKYLQYRTESFMRHASERIGNTVSKEVLEEIKEVSENKNNLDEIINLVKYSPATTLRRIEGMREVKIEKEIKPREFYSRAVNEIDNFILDALLNGRDVYGRHLSELYRLRGQNENLNMEFYIKKNGHLRHKIVDEISNELRGAANRERMVALQKLRQRIAVRQSSSPE